MCGVMDFVVMACIWLLFIYGAGADPEIFQGRWLSMKVKKI